MTVNSGLLPRGLGTSIHSFCWEPASLVSHPEAPEATQARPPPASDSGGRRRRWPQSGLITGGLWAGPGEGRGRRRGLSPPVPLARAGKGSFRSWSRNLVTSDSPWSMLCTMGVIVNIMETLHSLGPLEYIHTHPSVCAHIQIYARVSNYIQMCSNTYTHIQIYT